MGEPKKSQEISEVVVITAESMQSGSQTGQIILSNNSMSQTSGNQNNLHGEENTSFSDTFGETGGQMPSVTKLLQRKKIGSTKPDMKGAAKAAIPAAPVLTSTPNVVGTKTFSAAKVLPLDTTKPKSEIEVVDTSYALEQKTTTLSKMRAQGTPPEFKSELIIEQCGFATLKKKISKYRKSTDLKKLSTLGYFSMHFSEVAYFELAHSGTLKGVFGFGNPKLVVNTKNVKVSSQGFQALFEILSNASIFIGSGEGFKPQDLGSFRTLGFNLTDCIGVFPVITKKTLRGVWLCSGMHMANIDLKEQKKLLKILADV